MGSFFQDLRHSQRMFWQHRGFALAAVTALALGIGANTAIFSLVNTMLLKPPPFAEADRLVLLMNTTKEGNSYPGAAPAKFARWARQTDVLEHPAVFRAAVLNWTGGDVPEQLRAARVTREFFTLFGARIILGRTFSAAEDRPNGPPSALIGETLWRNRFKADPDIVGKAIQLSGAPHAIAGVVTAAFDFRDFAPQPDLYVPMQLDPESNDLGDYFQAAARLRPGLTQCCFR